MQQITLPQQATMGALKCEFDSRLCSDQAVLCCYFVWTSFVYDVLLCHHKHQNGTTNQHKFCVKLGKNHTTMYEMLQTDYGDKFLS
jgi:hypothetical protein